jgi:hypothetical protein
MCFTTIPLIKRLRPTEMPLTAVLMVLILPKRENVGFKTRAGRASLANTRTSPIQRPHFAILAIQVNSKTNKVKNHVKSAKLVITPGSKAAKTATNAQAGIILRRVRVNTANTALKDGPVDPTQHVFKTF